MKCIAAIFALFLAVSSFAKDPSVPLSMCEVLAKPLGFGGKELTVSGWMSLSFESFAFGCRHPEEKKGLQFIWISFDFASIEKESPGFLSEVRADIQKANPLDGGVKREIVVRGRLEFSKHMLTDPEKAPPSSGYGHLGSSPGQLVVLEILKYGLNQ